MKTAHALLAFTINIVALGQASAQATDPAPVKPIKEKKICRKEEVTGSIMGTSICHTAQQWAAIDKQHAEDGEAMRNRAQAPGSGL